MFKRYFSKRLAKTQDLTFGNVSLVRFQIKDFIHPRKEKRSTITNIYVEPRNVSKFHITPTVITVILSKVLAYIKDSAF